MLSKDQYLEVPVTYENLDVYSIRITPEVLEQASCKSADEFRRRMMSRDLHPFDFDGKWDNKGGGPEEIHYEEAKVC